MTTIAFDGKILASDSRMTSNNEIMRGNVNKISIRKDYAFCLAGTFAAFEPLVKWFTKGAIEADFPSLNMQYTFLVIDKKLKVTVYSSNNGSHKTKYKAPIAIGSGQDFATGAMAIGANAKQAVKAASKLDIYTGGKIKSVDLSKRFATKQGPKKRR